MLWRGAMGRQGDCYAANTINLAHHGLCRVAQRGHLRGDLRIGGFYYKAHHIALDRQSADQIVIKDRFPIRQHHPGQSRFDVGFRERHDIFLSRLLLTWQFLAKSQPYVRMPHSTKAKRTFSAQKLSKTPMFSLHGSNAQFENCANAAIRSKRFQERRHCEPRIRPNSSILLPDVFVFGGDTLLLPGIVAVFFHTIPPDC